MKLQNYFLIPALAVTALLVPTAGLAQTKIYIDPGHGGTDPGAVNSTFGTEEADRNLFTGLALRDYLDADTADAGGGGTWQVRLSRTTDIDVGLTARATDSNNWGASRFLSIHQNAFNSSANGTETFSASSTGTAAQLSAIVQSEAIEAWNRVNRGIKTANFTVLTATSAPAILTEMGFVDSPADHPFCSSDVQCDLYALHMLFALQQHFSLAEHTPAMGTQVLLDAVISSTYSETGGWSTSGSAGAQGANSRFAIVQGQTNTATFTPNITEAGEYRVEAWWIAGANRSNAAVFVVNHASGSNNVTVNMETNGSQWNTLGNFDFTVGSSLTIVLDGGLSNDEGDPGTVIIADALRLTRIGDLVSSVDDFELIGLD